MSVLSDVRNRTTFDWQKCFISQHKNLGDIWHERLIFEGLKFCLNCGSRKAIKMNSSKTPEFIFSPVNHVCPNWALFSSAHTGLDTNPDKSELDVIEVPRQSS